MLQDNHLYATEPNQSERLGFKSSLPLQPQLNINVHYSHSQSRSKVEAFILDKFQDRHSATIREFMPVLIDLGYDNTKNAAIGIRPGVNRPFFLENYLDGSIEYALKELIGVSVDRERIVEIGNFAANHVRVGSLLFTLLAKVLLEAGYQWMVFTATNEVEKMINKLGCRQTILTDANASRVEQSSSDWGSYYDNNPKVIACKLQDTIDRAETNTRLNQVFLSHASHVIRLARELQPANKRVAA
jgi:hypothetical protein